jgi:hypothetical protein
VTDSDKIRVVLLWHASILLSTRFFFLGQDEQPNRHRIENHAMTEPVMYMRGFPLLSASVNDGLVEDIKAFLKFDESSIQAVCSELSSEQGFLSGKKFRSALAEMEIAEEQGEVIYRIIRWADKLRRTGFLDNAWRMLQSVTSEDAPDPTFSEDEVAQAKDRILRLFASAPSLERQAKAVELSSATGQRLQEMKLICDLRPVFNKERNQIEGVLPITTIRLVCEGADGLPLSFDAVMSEVDVDQLFEIASYAKQKLASIRELSDRMNLPIPTTQLTTSKGNDVKASE